MDQGLPPVVYPTAATRTPQSLNGQGVVYMPYDTPMQYAAQWRFEIQRQIKRELMLSLAYVGTSAFHLNLTRDANQVQPQYIHLAASGANMQPYRPFPTYTSISTAYMDGNSNYHALQVSLLRRFSNGVSFRANYSWSKAMDDGTGSGWYTGYVGGDGYQNGWDRRSNYGLSKLNMPQMLNGYVTYELPAGMGRQFFNRGVASNILGGWDISGVFQVHSGVPFTPVIGTANLSGSLGGSAWWLPNRIANGSLPDPTIGKWFDPTAFVTPAPGSFGNSGRDILFGPGWEQIDVNVTKKFRIRKLGEAATFQFRADARDLLNHPNLGQPNTSLGTPGVGQISSANSSRVLQLGVRLMF